MDVDEKQSTVDLPLKLVLNVCSVCQSLFLHVHPLARVHPCGAEGRQRAYGTPYRSVMCSVLTWPVIVAYLQVVLGS